MNQTTLRSFRRSHDISQKDMAKILGMSIPAYNKRESGKQEFKLGEIVIIKEHFNLTYEQVWAYFFTHKLHANRNKKIAG